ncbi:hypothetical protein [Apilactobacillus ozensis]|uniref:hypothetical protein n=1 Tax=Apilactobacillus ozensis TaxID=866801 RepID=UPI00200A6CB3|nr:hypothetical protein [Apilactobacillus ozensis]MCK8607398.1 hypothetical protein [Apilactobacillus ozensis]
MKSKLILLLSYILFIFLFITVNAISTQAYVKYYNYSKDKLIKPLADINDLTRLRFPKDKDEEYYVNYYSTKNGYDFQSKYSPFALVKPSFNDKNYSILRYQMGVPMNKSGARRYIEYRVKPSADLNDAISSFDIEPIGIKESKPGSENEKRYNNNGLNPSPYRYSLNDKNFKNQDSDGINTYVSSSYLNNSNGGNAIVTVRLKDVFINKNSMIYTYMISNTLHIYRSNGQKNGSESVYPTFEALRSINYDDMQGDKHNSYVLNQLKNKAKNQINGEYEELVNRIKNLDNPPYDEYIKSSMLSELQKYKQGSSIDDSFGIYNIDKIEDKDSNYKDKINNQLDDIVETTTSKMKSVILNFKYLKMAMMPDLDFGTHFINNFKSISLDKNIVSTIRSFNSKAYSINLSISNLKNADGYSLNPAYDFDGNIYKYDESFMYYNIVNSPNGDNKIITDKDEIKLIVPISRIKVGNYTGTATWNIRKGPS